MDLVNDLSSDLALAVLVDGTLVRKLGAQDAKSFIESVEAELSRISQDTERLDPSPTLPAVFTGVSH
jgi:hypothetical protein